MNHLKDPRYIAGTLVLIFLAFLGWNYTEAIKEKNAIEREQISLKAASDSLKFELQQKERCLELKADFQKKQPPLEGFAVPVTESVIFSKKDNTCYLYTQVLLVGVEGTWRDKQQFSIVDLFKETPVIWYPSAGQWTLEEFLKKKEELGF